MKTLNIIMIQDRYREDLIKHVNRPFLSITIYVRSIRRRRDQPITYYRMHPWNWTKRTIP